MLTKSKTRVKTKSVKLSPVSDISLNHYILLLSHIVISLLGMLYETSKHVVKGVHITENMGYIYVDHDDVSSHLVLS